METSRSLNLATPRSLIALVVFLVVTIGISTAIGLVTGPGEWYATLAKPPFNPPNWLFGPVWLVLYVLIAIAGWRTYMVEGWGPTMRLWSLQMVLNWVWTPVFFTLHWLWPALIVILLLLMTILTFIAVRWDRDRVSTWCFMPYAAWVAFATVLNLSIALLN